MQIVNCGWYIDGQLLAFHNQVAIVLQGRHAGKKVVVIKQFDEERKANEPGAKILYPHAIVAGIERYPRKVTRRMGQKKVGRRSKVKPFIKVRFLLGSPSIALLTPTL